MFRAGAGLVILGFLAGDGLALVGLGMFMYKSRKQDRSIMFLSGLFFSQALMLLVWLIAATTSLTVACRTSEYRILISVALGCLALGVWPTYLHFIHGWWTNGHPPLIVDETKEQPQ